MHAVKKPTSKHEDDEKQEEKQEEMFTPVKHTIQVSDSPEMDPPLKSPDGTLLSKVTKEEPVLSDRTKAEMAAGAAAVKAEEEKLAAREKAKGEAQK
jgi:hypothetical protein